MTNQFHIQQLRLTNREVGYVEDKDLTKYLIIVTCANTSTPLIQGSDPMTYKPRWHVAREKPPPRRTIAVH